MGTAFRFSGPRSPCSNWSSADKSGWSNGKGNRRSSRRAVQRLVRHSELDPNVTDAVDPAVNKRAAIARI